MQVDRDLVERHIERVIVSGDAIEIRLIPQGGGANINSGLTDMGAVHRGNDEAERVPVTSGCPGSRDPRLPSKASNIYLQRRHRSNTRRKRHCSPRSREQEAGSTTSPAVA